MCGIKLLIYVNIIASVLGGPTEGFNNKKGFTALLPSDPCYDEDRPRRCLPDFVNAAFGIPILSSSTCGLKGPEKYCDSNLTDSPAQCSMCDDKNPKRKFPATYLTDINNSNNLTCWRSESFIQPSEINAAPDNITLTLSLGKKYELTYVSLLFCPRSVKPDSLAIYKSNDYGKTFQPFQFYSSQCRRFYGRPNRATITKNNEQEALCTDSHRHNGDTTTLQGSRIAFSTLEGRPSAPDFDSSPILQDWVTVTDIRVIFHRLQVPQESEEEDDGGVYMESTKPALKIVKDENYGDNDSNQIDLQTTSISSVNINPVILQHYALSDFTVGGRCKCNGHGSRCVRGVDGQMECECRHNTAGRDCEKCKLFYFDRPWGRATTRDSSECKGECDKEFVHEKFPFEKVLHTSVVITQHFY